MTPPAPAPALEFKVVHVRAGHEDAPATHNTGQFVHAISGVIEVGMAGRVLLAPPQYGVWIPPGLEHVSSNRHEASYATLYVPQPWCAELPAQACTLAVNPLMLALLDTLREGTTTWLHAAKAQRLLWVLLDQLAEAPPHDSYLPMSQDPLLAQVLHALQAQPWDTRSLAEWAGSVHTTERTLARRCQRDLNMPFNEWRQRLKVLKGIALLEAGHAVKRVAMDLGYSAPSAFISMFQRQVGLTPQAYMQHKRGSR